MDKIRKEHRTWNMSRIKGKILSQKFRLESYWTEWSTVYQDHPWSWFSVRIQERRLIVKVSEM